MRCAFATSVGSAVSVYRVERLGDVLYMKDAPLSVGYEAIERLFVSQTRAVPGPAF